MQPVEVIARFDPQGQITPLRFAWKGQEYPIDSAGRRWVDKDGIHFLVMVVFDKVFELVFVPEEFRWYLSETKSQIRSA